MNSPVNRLWLPGALAVCLLIATGGAGRCSAAVQTEPDSCPTRPCTYTIRCAAAVCTNAEVAEVQRAIDEAHLGDTIRLEAGRTFPVTSGLYGLQLKAKRSGSGYITITTTEAARLPDEDTRITPDYAPLMPTIRADVAPFSAMTTENGPAPAEHYKLIGLRFTNHPARDISRGFLQIGNPTGYKDAFSVDPERDLLLTERSIPIDVGAWVLLYTTGTLPGGLEPNTRYYVVRNSSQQMQLALTRGGRPVDIRDAGHGVHTYVEEGLIHPDLQAGDIVVDRCIFTGTYDRQIRKGIALHGRNLVVRNSFIERIQALGVDTQGIASHNGTGPFLIENNYIDGVTENIMFGGARGLAPDNPPADERGVTSADAIIRFNYLPKIPERYKWESWSSGMYVDAGKLVYAPNHRERGYIAQNAGTTGTVEPNWPDDIGATVEDGEITWRAYSRNGSHFVVKNNFELKKGERMLIEHNVFDRMWRDGQEAAINIKSQDEPQGCLKTDNVTCYAGRTENIVIRNNIVRSAPRAFKVSKQGLTGINWHIVNNLFVDIDPVAHGGGRESQALISGNPPAGLVIEHNTIIARNAGGAITMDTTNGHDTLPVVLRNNILSRGTMGMKGSGKGEGAPSFEFFLCKREPCPDEQVGRNIIVGVDRRKYPNGTFNACPGDEACEPSYEFIGFRDPANEDYGLSEDSSYRGQATDETDIGVDMSQLPQIRNLRVHASATQAEFAWELSEPIREIPCVLQVSEHRNLSQPAPDVNPALFTRADSDRSRDPANDKAASRQFIVGSDAVETGLDGSPYSRRLSPGTTYYYRLMCGGDTRLGSFATERE